MKRTQIYLSEEQHEVLRRIAFEQHKSISQVIRDVVDCYCKSPKNVDQTAADVSSDRLLATKKQETDELGVGIKEKISTALEPNRLKEIREATESLKGVVSEERYKHLTKALEEYRKSLEDLSKYS